MAPRGPHTVFRALLSCVLACALAVSPALSLSGCGASGGDGSASPSPEEGSEDGEEASFRNPDVGAGLALEDSLELSYAENFTVDYYESGEKLVCISDESRYLVVPEGWEEPQGLDPDVVVLEEPIEDVYLVASDTMCLLDALDVLDRVRVSGLEEEDWSVEGAVAAMEAGEMVYGGKYDSPDYDLLLSEGVGLAIESTMIDHAPEVKDKLQTLGIEVLTEQSSYESSPFGRLEWVKLYGALFGCENRAEEVFDGQLALAREAVESEPTGKTVAFFYINSNGAAVVRKPGDYVTEMIELAGGTYVFDELGDGSSSASVTLEMESFYSEAKDADVIIYNASIGGELASIEELVEKNSLLADFEAVRNGEVWCASEDMYQQMIATGAIISEFHAAFEGEDDEGLEYLVRLE